MKFRSAASFDRDFARLAPEHRRSFLVAVPGFHEAASRAAAGAPSPWPRGQRIKRVQGYPEIWETTWHKSRPDGRATWRWITIDDQPAIQWRRIGDHGIFKAP